MYVPPGHEVLEQWLYLKYAVNIDELRKRHRCAFTNIWHDDFIKWKLFPRYDPVCAEFTGHVGDGSTYLAISLSYFMLFYIGLVCGGCISKL